MSTGDAGKLLLLSVGYGQGHHSAAAALAERYEESGWHCRIVDICAEAHPVAFRCTQLFYQFCVRRAPWLWGVTYSLTGTADWSRMVQWPLFNGLLECTRNMLEEWQPELILCTYPLFAYMLDALRNRGCHVPPYALVVTDAREISRPWMRSEAALVLVPDDGSRSRVIERYALPDDRVITTGFPVKGAFGPSEHRGAPGASLLKVLYGAYRQTQGVVNDIAAMLAEFPQMQLTVLAGRRARALQRLFKTECASGRLVVLQETDCMHRLLGGSHFYVGKAGAATMFECYASRVPMLVNFLLPGQELGNLELLQEDAAGFHVESTAHLVATLRSLLADDAAGWKRLCGAMHLSGRTGAAARIESVVRLKYGV